VEERRGMSKKMIDVLNMIIADCSQDVNDFDGREFNGKTLGELHGIIEAKVEALAKIIIKVIEQQPNKD